MAKANGTMVYPLTIEVNESLANEAYANMTTEFSSGTAFKDVSVNPKLKATFVEAEQNGTGSATSDVVASAIFTEIRKGPCGTSISNDRADMIGNRILPHNKTLTSYATNKEITPPYKVKVFDENASEGETNRKFVYSTVTNSSSAPATDTLALDIENYDYFILLNPEIYDSTTQSDTARPHFAKITSIVTFADFGDGLEFSPKYPTPIPKGTNFEVFKGPAKTATDVMAVSYGLRGDNQASTDNYDVLNLVATPTFYFYNERLEQDDQLDYMEKYTLTRLRWYDYSASVTMTSNTEIALYSEGSSTVKFTTNGTSETDKLCEGMSLFDSGTDEWYGNIKEITGNDIHLEVAYKAKSATTNNFTVKIGKGIQNIVFRTHAKLKGTIESISRTRLDATLVDHLRTTDDADGSFDPMFWHKAFPNMKRHESDSTSATASTLDGNRNGPSRYITSDPRPRRNDIVPLVTDVIVNSPQNKMSKMCKFKAMNNSGILPEKYKEGQTLKVMKNLFSDNMSFKTLPFKASKSSSVGNSIEFHDMDDAHDYKLSEKLPTDSIILVDGYYYVVNAVAVKSGTTQTLTVKANKTLHANTFTVSNSVHEFSNATVQIAPWTEVLNTEDFDSDTQVHYADGNRLTVSGTTINKEDSKLYNTKVVFPRVSTHQNTVDYVDKDMEYVKFQDSDRKFYQNTSNSRFYYYEGTYSLQEEAFDGTIELSETETDNGLTLLTLEGRDNSSSLLNTQVNQNLLFTEDIIHSTLNPVMPLSNTETLTNVSVSGKVITHASGDNFTPTAKMLLFTRNTGVFIGEVASATATEITLTHKPLAHMSATTNIWYYNPFTEVTFLSGTKALGSNPAITSTTDFRGVSDKGVILQDSFSFDVSLNKTKLEGTSNSGSFLENRTLGYDIQKPISIDILDSDVSTEDSVFAFQLSDELGTSTTDVSMMTFASERFNVLDIIEKDDGGARMRIAPTCPVVMGRVENNTSDTRTGFSFYLVNNGINDGGFLHRFDTGHTTSANLDLIASDDIYTPRETFRYWDLQKFSSGTIKKTSGGIYNRSSKQQNIRGYAVAYPILGTGDAPASTTLTESSRPIFGSNMVNSNFTHVNTAGSIFDATTGVSTLVPPTRIMESKVKLTTFQPLIDWENLDGKAQAYELFATGDLYPYSKLRYNNIGSQTLNYDDLACLLESEGGISATETTHSEYDGKSKSMDKTDNNFERASIKAANKTTNQIKRFGIARLVEATFDWHFNPVDADSLENTSAYEENYGTYALLRSREASKDNLKFSVASGSVSLSWTNGGTLTIPPYSTIFNANNGELIATTGLNSQTVSSTGTINATMHNSTTATNVEAYLIPEYGNSNAAPFFTVDGFDTLKSTNSSDVMDMSKIILIRPNYKGSDSTDILDAVHSFKYARLTNGDGTPNAYNPPGVLLPFIFNAERNSADTAAELLNARKSPYHDSQQWSNSLFPNPPYLHLSRVLAGLMQNFRGSSTLTTTSKMGYADNVHPYENCIAVFRDIKKISSVGPDVPEDMFQTSCFLGTRPFIGIYNNYQGGTFTTPNDFDQHTPNTMVYAVSTGNFKAVTGTHTLETKSSTGDAISGSNANSVTTGVPTYFMDKKKGDTVSTSRVQNHVDLTSNDGGGVYSARMLIKPLINTSDGNVTLSNGNRTLTIDLDDVDSAHSWLEFAPNLTGYYLVGNRGIESSNETSLGSNDISGGNKDTLGISSNDTLNIAYMGKIVSHTHSTSSVSDSSRVHTIILDEAIYSGAGGSELPFFRLMRLAETTFRDTPNEIVLNQLFSTGLDYTETSSGYRTGTLGNPNYLGFAENHQHTNEGVFSAYVLLNLDSAPSPAVVEGAHACQSAFSRTFRESVEMLPYNDGDTFEVMVSDGETKYVKTMTVDLTLNSTTAGIRRNKFRLTYDGVLNGKGVVSFGEIINLELRRKPSLQNITACHIGTSMIIGEEIETHMDKIIRDAGMTSDLIQTQSEFTGNIVQSVANNLITCKATVENLEQGDVIYTHEGYPIGVVGSVSGSIITVTDVHTDGDVDLWFNPVLNDEIIKRNKKTFIATNNFSNKPAYETLNEMAGKKGLDFKVRNKKVVFRDLKSKALTRKQTISYGTHRIFSVKKNSSLFAKANKVTVVGDKISTTVERNVKGKGTHITFVDPTLRNISDVKIKANELLELHNQDSRKITLNLEKKGLETLEAGDVVYLDMTQHGIPAGDYMIFEIENVLSSQLTMTVGTFDMTIAERLAELGSKQRSNSSTLFSRNAESVSTGLSLRDSISLKTTLVQYTITGSGESSNMGFDDLVGFSEEVGFENTGSQVIGYYTSED